MCINDENKINFNISNFSKIPGSTLAYWASNEIIENFGNDSIEDVANPRQGLATGNNDKYLKYWFEINFNEIGFNYNSNEDFLQSKKVYAPHNKGGNYRKWYGNYEYVIKFNQKAYNELLNLGNHLPSRELYFKPSVSWSKVASNRFSTRYIVKGCVFDGAGSSLFANEELLYWLLGLTNSKITQIYKNVINPTLGFQVGDMRKIPVIYKDNYKKEILDLVKENISICKTDWDNYETSWDFKSHFLINFNNNQLKQIYKEWVVFSESQFNKLKLNEEKLNRLFSNIYKVPFDISVNNKDISISESNLELDIKSFISYAIGCMFGRYSLDNDGLQFAGGEFNIPDDDNIIPVLDTAYFDDDIVGYFTKFVEICFGEETLEQNLDFIAGALSKSNKPSREIIRQYLLKNFFNDHKKIYKKCPIYWQFSSGKENGFNCLVYMHRYEPSLVARIRTDYLHKTQKAIEQAIVNCDNIINHSSSNTEISKANKDKSKLQKQLKETQEYDEALAHIANQNIQIDLNDGVKVNYAKFQNIIVSKEGKKSKKINLLKKL